MGTQGACVLDMDNTGSSGHSSANLSSSLPFLPNTLLPLQTQRRSTVQCISRIQPEEHPSFFLLALPVCRNHPSAPRHFSQVNDSPRIILSLCSTIFCFCRWEGNGVAVFREQGRQRVSGPMFLTFFRIWYSTPFCPQM